MIEITIKNASVNDLSEMKQLFVSTIKNVCSNDYSPDQIEVWTSSIHNKQRWEGVLSNQHVFLAKSNKALIGFATLKDNQYIDLLYVHKDFQGCNVASSLLSVLEKTAVENGSNTLSSDVSITARPFFQKMGFDTQQEQIVVLKGLEFTNFRMSKNLNDEHLG
ncbi:MAG: GNAT family N-acetyltransferase [Salibacteraceae bacterium]